MVVSSGLHFSSSVQSHHKCAKNSRAVVVRASLNAKSFPSVKVPPYLRTSRGAKVLRRAFERQGGSGAVMEKTRNFFVMPTAPSAAPKLDDSGNGGDMGKNIHNGGGGGGGGGDGDDDDYFQDGDDDGEGDGHRGPAGRFVAAFSLLRQMVPEQYDEFSIAAVFAEWMKTVTELPAVVRQAVQLGALSSAQLVRFLSMDVRPNAVRVATRSLPPELSRGLVGRLMADPAFLHKLFFETALAGVSTFTYEMRLRGDRLRDEMDVALTNTVTASAAAFASVWLIAPTRNFGAVKYAGWRQALDSLPNNVFDVGSPLLPYSLSSRFAGFLAKAAELSAVGLLSGTVSSLAGSAIVAFRQSHPATSKASAHSASAHSAPAKAKAQKKIASAAANLPPEEQFSADSASNAVTAEEQTTATPVGNVASAQEQQEQELQSVAADRVSVLTTAEQEGEVESEGRRAGALLSSASSSSASSSSSATVESVESEPEAVSSTAGRYAPSVPVPDAALSSAGLAAYYGLSANLRYQLIGGAEQFLFGHSRHLSFYLAASALLRVANAQVGDLHRPLCQGLPQLPPPSLDDVVGRAADLVAAMPNWRRLARRARLALVPDLSELTELTSLLRQSVSSSTTHHSRPYKAV